MSNPSPDESSVLSTTLTFDEPLPLGKYRGVVELVIHPDGSVEIESMIEEYSVGQASVLDKRCVDSRSLASGTRGPEHRDGG